MGWMLKRPKNKARLGAWLPANMAAAVDEWLAKHPGKRRTDFVIEAMAEHLKREGVLLPRSVFAARREPKPVSRGGKVLFASWVDERILAGIDLWREHHPNVNRSEFVINSVTAKLQENGVNLTIETYLSRRRLPKGAYEGIRLKGNSNDRRSRKRIETAMRKWGKRTDRFLARWRCESARYPAPAGGDPAEKLLAAKAAFTAALQEMDKLQKELNLLEGEYKALGLRLPELGSPNA